MTRTRIVRVERTDVECSHTVTIRFQDESLARPGQFVMVWIPGLDEVPMSFSYIGDLKGVTVHNVGEATAALHDASRGDKLGIRGPFGRDYRIEGESILFVSGGTGAASLMPALEVAMGSGIRSTIVIGAKTASELIFVDRAISLGADVRISTDDGSKEYKGFASDLALQVLQEGSFDRVLTCGPERMMKTVVTACLEKGIPVQVSLERFMRCGMGICDSCSFGGLHVCVDGPVFDGKDIIEIEDFGVFRRSADGSREVIP
ncbi:MAG: dihydroorotate dehydrogenase electron transfer subunit [Thermoplasmata archaeon]|nr:dihydroorotate dehydrogenase electron transfer subunit [Thermoplasmata archaeon]